MNCSYCGEEMQMPSRHEPNCRLNPYFQTRYYQLPREYILKLMKNDQFLFPFEWYHERIKT